MKKNYLPKGWTEAKIKRVIEYYDNQTDEEAAAEMEEAFKSDCYVFIEVPHKLLPQVRKLIAQFEAQTRKQKKVRISKRRTGVAGRKK